MSRYTQIITTFTKTEPRTYTAPSFYKGEHCGIRCYYAVLSNGIISVLSTEYTHSIQTAQRLFDHDHLDEEITPAEFDAAHLIADAAVERLRPVPYKSSRHAALDDAEEDALREDREARAERERFYSDGKHR